MTHTVIKDLRLSHQNTNGTHDPAQWRVDIRVDKRDGDWTWDEIISGAAPDPYETVLDSQNLLTFGGSSALWDKLINGASSITTFNNANTYIGVGDSATVEAGTQTDLQASSNKLRKIMDATYPTHTDGTSSSSYASCQFQATFTSAEANFAWNEWIIVNHATTGRALNRKVQSLGTKGAGSSWTLNVSISIS